MLPPPVPDDRLSHLLHLLYQRDNYRRAQRDKRKSHFANLLMVRWTESFWVAITLYVLISRRASCKRGAYNRYLQPLICWPRMDHRSAFRASVLLACVIICSNVLCPVGAYLYNNRYAGWVKTPIHFWGSWASAREAHALSFCRKSAQPDEKFSAEIINTKSRALSYVEPIENEQRKSLCSLTSVFSLP